MIALKVCHCGRTLDASAWSALTPLGRCVLDGKEWRRRRCACGREIAVTMHEDDAAQEIDRARFEARLAYGRARLEVAMLRAARAGSFPSRWGSFSIVRAEARAARATAQRLEAMLLSIYRDRESKSPALRVGRNMILVDADVAAPTQRNAR